MPKMESRICEDHELWNHEMRGPPVYIKTDEVVNKQQNIYKAFKFVSVVKNL